MYENVSRKIKGFVKVFTILLWIVTLLAGIAAAVWLIRKGGTAGILLGIAAVLGALALDVLFYYLSCFAYGFGLLLEHQATGICLDRQMLNTLRDLAASGESPCAPPPVRPASQAPAYPGPGGRPYAAGQPPMAAVPPNYAYPPASAPPVQPVQPTSQPYAGACRNQPAYPLYDSQGEYRTRTPHGTATGFNENFHYEPKR